MCKPVIMVMLLLVGVQAAPAADVKTLLQRADAYRLSEQSAKVVTRVELYKNERLDKNRLYHVYLKPGRRSLVVMKSPEELGQKVLMLDDKFWLVMPSSKQPIRITATQKLLGEASTGDVATMTWSGDYDGNLVGRESLKGVAALKLDLHSIREGTTYARIVLWIRDDDYQPLQAELYVASGKLAKVAYYEMGPLNGRSQVVRTRLEDRIQQNRYTLMQVQSIAPAEVPEKVYNPAYLLRNDLKDW